MAEDFLGTGWVAVRASLEKLYDDLQDAEGVTAKAVERIGKKTGDIGKAMSVGITAPILAIGTAAIAASLVVDDALDSIRLSTGATGAALESLEGSFTSVFESVPSSAEDVATAIGDLNTRTGLMGEELENLAVQSLNLARISKGDLAAQIAANTRLFGDWSVATKDQGATLDFLWKVSQSTGAGIEELSAKVVQFGAPLRQMGFGLEESLALLGKWEKEGVNAELVLGSLRIALGKFAEEGVADTNAALTEWIAKIKEAGSTGEANALAMEVFGKKAGPDMAAAIREGRFEIAELLTQLRASPESINGAAEATDGFVEKLQLLKNQAIAALEPLGTELIEVAGDALRALEPLIRLVTELAKAFGSLPEPVKTGIIAVAGIAAGAGPALTAIGALLGKLQGLVSAAPGIIAAIRGVGAALAANAALAGPVAAGVAGLASITYTGAQAWGLYRDRQEQARLAGEQNKSFVMAMASASKLAGREITDLAEAHRILQADAARQRAEQEAGIKVTVTAGAAARTQAEETNKLRTALQAAQAEASKLTAAKRAEIAAGLELGQSHKDIAAAVGVSEAAIGIYVERLEASKKKAEEAAEAAKKFAASVSFQSFKGVGFAATLEDTETAARRVGDSIHNIASGDVGEMVAGLRRAREETAAWEAQWGGLAPAMTGFKGSLNEVEAKTQKIGANWTNIGKSLSSTILKAVQGGGNIGEAIGTDLGGQLGQKAGELAASKIGGALGGMIGTVAGPLGSIAGGLIGKFAGAGISKLLKSEGKKVNDLRDDFVSAAGGIDKLNARAVAAGMSLDELLKAKKVEDFQKAVNNLNLGFEKSAQDIELAKAAAEEFGITFEEMGQAFKQGEMDDAGAGLLDKIRALLASGVSLDTVIQKAGDNVGAYIQRCIEAGVTVPRELEPIAQKMIEQGALIDANGDAFTELGQIPFADGPNEKLASIAESLEKIAGFFTSMLPAAAQRGADGVERALDGIRPQPIDVPVRFQTQGDVPGMGSNPNFDIEVPGMATGGVILEPTLLAAGEAGPEAFVPLDRMGAMLQGARNEGLSDALGGKIDKLAATISRQQADLPTMMALAFRDVMRGRAI